MNDSAIYKFYWDWGRMGDVTGVFTASKEEIKKALGKRIYFGEILGKHSEIYGFLEEKDLTMVTDDKKVVALFSEYGLASGYNPLQYIVE